MIFITSIRMQGGQGHEHIARLRWINPQNTNTGESSTAEIVNWIDQGGAAKVRISSGQAVAVGVVRPSAHPAYLRTYADNTWTDNLLSLPRF